MSKTFREGWLELVYLLNHLIRDAVGGLLIIGIFHLIEIGISNIEGNGWNLPFVGTVKASTIVHYGDLVILITFVVLSVANFYREMRR